MNHSLSRIYDIENWQLTAVNAQGKHGLVRHPVYKKRMLKSWQIGTQQGEYQLHPATQQKLSRSTDVFATRHVGVVQCSVTWCVSRSVQCYCAPHRHTDMPPKFTQVIFCYAFYRRYCQIKQRDVGPVGRYKSSAPQCCTCFVVICRLCKFTLSDQVQVTLQLSVRLSDFV